MRSIRRAAAVAVAAGVIAVAGTGAAQAAPSGGAAPAGAGQGCPGGYVCLYPGAGWNNGHPSVMYYADGYFATTFTGVHRVMGNRVDGSVVRLCERRVFADCTTVPEGSYVDYDFTPVTVLEIGV